MMPKRCKGRGNGLHHGSGPYRLAEWHALLSGLRQKHKAKRRLLSELDSLSGRKISE